MPASARWVRLEVTANEVGLEGQTAYGAAFTTYGGTTSWNHSAMVSSSGKETVWFEDSMPAGAVVYAAWNWERTGPEADFGFTGHFYHQKSGLHLASYRAYSADLGRWLNRDPIRSAELREGPNLYLYVQNRSVKSVDPFGLTAEDELAQHVKNKDCPRSCICKALQGFQKGVEALQNVIRGNTGMTNLGQLDAALEGQGVFQVGARGFFSGNAVGKGKAVKSVKKGSRT